MDRFEAMAAFVSVVEAGGFSAASRKLGMPLATISRKVSELEAQLNAQLLTRSTRHVALTAIGQEYFATCRRLLQDLAEAERLASGEHRAPRGSLVVNAPIVFGRLYLMPIVVEFLQAFPEVDVELRLADSIGNLIEEHADIALRIGHLPDSNLTALRAGEIRQVVCASPDYVGRRGAPARPAELSGHDCITFTALHSAVEWVFGAGRGMKRVPVHSRLVVNTAEAAADAAIAGAGITRLLCYQVSQAIAERRLQLLLRAHEPTPMPVHLVFVGGRLVPQKLRAFLDFVLPRLKARLVFDPQ